MWKGLNTPAVEQDTNDDGLPGPGEEVFWGVVHVELELGPEQGLP